MSIYGPAGNNLVGDGAINIVVSMATGIRKVSPMSKVIDLSPLSNRTGWFHRAFVRIRIDLFRTQKMPARPHRYFGSIRKTDRLTVRSQSTRGIHNLQKPDR